MSVIVRCSSGDGDTVVVGEDVDDGSPSLLFHRKTGIATWVLLDDGQAREIAHELLRIADKPKPA